MSSVASWHRGGEKGNFRKNYKERTRRDSCRKRAMEGTQVKKRRLACLQGGNAASSSFPRGKGKSRFSLKSSGKRSPRKTSGGQVFREQAFRSAKKQRMGKFHRPAFAGKGGKKLEARAKGHKRRKKEDCFDRAGRAKSQPSIRHRRGKRKKRTPDFSKKKGKDNKTRREERS